MIVHERQNLAGVHVEEHDETDKVTGINAALATSDLHLFRKAGIDSERHGFHARYQSHNVVEVILPALFFPRRSQPRPWRIHRLTLTELTEGLFDRVDFLGHRQ